MEYETIKPLSPIDVVSAKIERIPPGVIQAFNELIAENWNGYNAVIKQREAISRILDKLSWDIGSGQQVVDKHYLDVEDIYKRVGWLVNYEKPGYNETGEATFTFSKNTRGF